jgi:hypothetical protein
MQNLNTGVYTKYSIDSFNQPVFELIYRLQTGWLPKQLQIHLHKIIYTPMLSIYNHAL